MSITFSLQHTDENVKLLLKQLTFLAHAPMLYNEIMFVYSVYLSVHNYKMILLEYALIAFHDTWIQCNKVEGQYRGVQEFWVKCHLGVYWDLC